MAESFDQFAIVELMGHMIIAGRVTEQVIGWGDLTVAIWQVADYGLRTYQDTPPLERGRTI